jgi:hypothetical protein
VASIKGLKLVHVKSFGATLGGALTNKIVCKIAAKESSKNLEFICNSFN